MNGQYLVMRYDAAKREVAFHRYRDGIEEQIRSSSKLNKYMNQRRGEFVLQDMGNTFLSDIAAAFDGLRRIEIQAIMTRADYDDFCRMVQRYNEGATCLIETSLVEELEEEKQTTAEQAVSDSSQEVSERTSHVPGDPRQLVQDAYDRHILRPGDPMPGSIGTFMEIFRENEQKDIKDVRAMVEGDVDSFSKRGLFGKKLVLSKSNKNRLVILFAGIMAGGYIEYKRESVEAARNAFLQEVRDGLAQNAEIGEELGNAILDVPLLEIAVGKVDFGFPTIDDSNLETYTKGLELAVRGYKKDYASQDKFVDAVLPEYIQAIRRLQAKAVEDYTREHNRALQAAKDAVLSRIDQIGL